MQLVTLEAAARSQAEGWRGLLAGDTPLRLSGVGTI